MRGEGRQGKNAAAPASPPRPRGVRVPAVPAQLCLGSDDSEEGREGERKGERRKEGGREEEGREESSRPPFLKFLILPKFYLSQLPSLDPRMVSPTRGFWVSACFMRVCE